jgi:hypothetical protein
MKCTCAASASMGVLCTCKRVPCGKHLPLGLSCDLDFGHRGLCIASAQRIREQLAHKPVRLAKYAWNVAGQGDLMTMTFSAADDAHAIKIAEKLASESESLRAPNRASVDIEVRRIHAEAPFHTSTVELEPLHPGEADPKPRRRT